MDTYLEIDNPEPGIFVLTFDRPDMLNALNLATMQAFQATLIDLEAAEDIRALIITGAGEQAFCSGGDLQELSRYPAETDARKMITVMGDALRLLEKLPFPVIAAINGYALGGGTEIALACDMRVVDEAVRFGMVQINMGLTPGWGAGQRLLRLVGYARAMQILLSGETLNADNLQALGLISEITVPGQALDTAIQLAKTISTKDPQVVYGIKSLLRAGLEHPYDKALRIERDIFPALWAADAHIDAVDAFLQRQAAKKRNMQD
ncbi:MAG: enoyl-CoA hydratase/isomerase family protein [Aggregatilineales bacterium]